MWPHISDFGAINGSCPIPAHRPVNCNVACTNGTLFCVPEIEEEIKADEKGGLDGKSMAEFRIKKNQVQSISLCLQAYVHTLTQ